jgi:hypothetical protein
MTTVPLDIQRSISLHLGGDQPFGQLFDPPRDLGLLHRSSFHALLTEARWATGRDEQTGALIAHKQGRRLIGTTAYLMLLDQIGSSFEPLKPRKLSVGVNSFLRALAHFSAIQDERERKALYALRNAFAHDYSLFNRNKNDLELQHAFHLSVNSYDPAVRLPSCPWDGHYPPFPEAIPHRQITEVNLQAVGDVVEGVVTEVRDLHAGGQLNLRPSLPEFEMRYGMVVSVEPEPEPRPPASSTSPISINLVVVTDPDQDH